MLTAGSVAAPVYDPAEREGALTGMATKVAIVGSHGTGKTTLVQAVGDALAAEGKAVDVVPEASRHLIESVGDPAWLQRQHNNLPRQLLILIAQYALEEAHVSDESDVVLCDRSMLDHVAYTRLLYEQEAPPDYWAKLVEFVEQHMATYDHLVYLPCEFALADDGVREPDDAYRQAVADRLRALLDASGRHYEVVGGSVGERVARVMALLGSGRAGHDGGGG